MADVDVENNLGLSIKYHDNGDGTYSEVVYSEGGAGASPDSTVSTKNVTAADAASTTSSGQNSQSIITGSPTANSAASFAITTEETLAIQITGTWSGTLQSEVSFDGGTTWYVRGLHQSGASAAPSSGVSSFTGNAGGIINVAGATNFRLRATAWVSGTATVGFTESTNSGVIYVSNDGTDATGVSQPSGGSGVRGWLSGVYNSLTNGNQKAQIVAGTSGGWTPSSQTALSSTVQAIKASAGQLGGIDIFNPNTSPVYIQFFNLATGSVTIGTTAPTFVKPIPAGAAANINWGAGIACNTAISWAATTTPTGSTAPASALTGFALYA